MPTLEEHITALATKSLNYAPLAIDLATDPVALIVFLEMLAMELCSIPHNDERAMVILKLKEARLWAQELLAMKEN